MSARSRCFLTSIGLRRSRDDSASIHRCRFMPALWLSQQCLPESCLTRLLCSLDATARGFGRRHRLGRTVSNKPEDLHTLRASGLPCWGNCNQVVTNQASPLPIHPNGKLMNQTPFSPEENEFRISYTGFVCLTRRRRHQNHRITS